MISSDSTAKIKTAMITGSSSGIGRAIAIKLAQQGWRVLLHGRTRSEKLLDVQKVVESTDGTALLFEQDFIHTEQLGTFVDHVWNTAGTVHTWINNAGGDVLQGEFADDPFEKKLEYLLAVDVRATLLISRAVGKKMKACALSSAEHLGTPASPFSIINMGWDQAQHGMAGESGEMFSTTKGAIMAMSRSLAQSLAPQVRVNCIAPGWIQTDWGKGTSDYWDHRAKSESLMNRWGTPDDIASVASFLCSEEAGFISGQVVAVNGGFRFGEGMREKG